MSVFTTGAILCELLFAMHPDVATPARLATCAQVARAATAAAVAPAEAVALGWFESKHTATAVSHAKARGPLQVTAGVCKRWKEAGRPGDRAEHQHHDGCDLIASGVWEWARLRAKYEPHRAACFYNAGPACPRAPRSQRWGRSVARLADRLRPPPRG